MTFIEQMAADSKMFQRSPAQFPVGVCVALSNPREFNSRYDNFFQEYFKNSSAKQLKHVYSSHEIRTHFRDNHLAYLTFLESFLRKVCDSSDVTINVTFTLINTQKLPGGNVSYYGSYKTSEKVVKPMTFINDLDKYYPYIAAWSVSEIAGVHGPMIAFDDLHGQLTKAWQQLKQNNHFLSIYPHGDQCRRDISAADLLVKYLDEKTFAERIRIGESELNGLFKSLKIENSNTFYVGNPHLQSIVPFDVRPIQLETYYKRPMVFVLKEGSLPHESKFLEARPEPLHAIQEFAFKNDTGYKLIDYSEDSNLIRDNDILIHYGPRGKEQVEVLETMSYKLNSVSLKDIMPK
jgi:hypothetical protein